MNRHPASLRSVAAAAAADMSYRPNLRGSRPRSWRGYCDNPSGSGSDFVPGDSHSPAVRDANVGFRPAYNAVPPPPQYYSGQQFHGPYRYPRHHGPGFGNNQQFRPQQMQQQFMPHQMQQQFRPQQMQQQFMPHQMQQQFRPQQMQQNFRPRASKPPDYREWEHASLAPPPECERFTVLSYNILADYLAIDHWHKLYFHIPHYMLNWTWRRRSIIFELGLWSADIMCFQEVDRFQDIEAELKQRGYDGIWKMRTGIPVDGCAIFWRVSRFKLLHEESIEYNKLGLRDNVAQICVFESLNGQNNSNDASSLSTSSAKPQRVVVCNIHVLFNPKRGDIKLGQIRVLLDRVHSVSKLWDDAPVVICGDFNCTPKSPLYNFITEQKLDLSELPRNKVSGQDSAEIRPSGSTLPKFRTQAADFRMVNESLTSPRDDIATPTSLVKGASDETVLLEPSCEDILSKSGDIRVCMESNLEKLPEVSAADVALDENFGSLSVNKLVNETTGECQEHSNSLLSRLDSTGQSPFPSDLNYSSDNSHGNEILKDTLHAEDEVVSDEGKLPYNPAAWTPMEIETATGSADCKVMEHPLNLTSSYTEVENSSGLRDSNGEPLVTSYHRRFLGTVDYIWHSEGLQTAKVLGPIPKHVMQQTPGFPTKKWGSDHIALVSELAFTKDTSSKNTS